ncbi:MAG TPA: DUF5916 domain-containing protein [Chitinophagaceae bacterium]
MKFIFLLAYFSFTSICLTAQKTNSAYQLHIRKATSSIIVDGEMNEQAWLNADVAKNFFQITPMDTSHAIVPTEVRMTYDNENLYIIATCYKVSSLPYMVESLRRDFNFGKNDNFIFCIDPFEDRTNGLTFGANAAGAQWDGMLYEGGTNNANWDNKWISAVKKYPDKYIFEAAIPFKTIRYKKGNTEWRVNFSRLDINVAEKSGWAPVPRQFPSVSLAYTGTLVWDQPPPDPGLNISVIPYALAGVSKDYEHKQKADYRKDIGGDAKIAITSSLNLDLTVNPDFSQVEVDKQVTNLDRYELFFPEKRQFFLENSDLFANFGYPNIRPFFSRRIGLGVPISFGARLSGSLSKDWRIGAMDIQTKSVDETGLPVQNFAVVALQRRVFSRSNIRFMFVNKQSINYDASKDTTKPQYSLYNRNVGIEYNLASSNNLWTGKALFLKSFSPEISDKDFVFADSLQYFNRKWKISWQNEVVGKNYIAEVGYVPRKNYIKFNPSIAYLFFPKKGKVLSHGPKISSTYFFDKTFSQTDNETFLSYIFNFRDQSTGDVWIAHDYVQLLQPFDPTNSGKDTLATGSRHRWNAFGMDYVSRPQQLFTFDFSTRFGGYYNNGTRLNLSGDLGYRFQPYVSITLGVSYNHIDLPEPWGQTDLWLIGPRVDVTFTNKLYFTTFIQYNNQLNNINLNTRLQWRYKPASDLFLVYTDNYFPAPFSVRTRALVLKFTYWWNI